MLTSTASAIIFVFSLLASLGGIVAVGIGAVAVIMIASLLQHGRYRSREAELLNPTAGPGAGEPGYLEPRFAPTAEVFMDPTSRRRMRVFFDPRTGERRYRAED
jgi:hypothetical protein